ncbi:hypothetical protein Tco_1151469, partial [Tanacetum coccineum]
MEQTSCALRCKKYVVLKILVLAFVVQYPVTSSTAGVKKMCEILYCSTAGDIMSKRSVPGIVLRRGAKGTEMKSVELALSMCDIVDIYGFTVDPGYTE